MARRPWITLSDDYDLSIFAKCMFPGYQSLRLVTRLESANTEVREYLNNVRFKRGWLTDINIRYNFSSPIRVDEITYDIARHLTTFFSLTKNVYDVFGDVYQNSTINEFIEQTISPLVRELTELEKSARKLMSFRVWPRRPILYKIDDRKQDPNKN